MKLLLTAFDPFGGEPVNPALEAVKLVSDTVGSVQVVKLEVPTVFGKSIDKVAKAIEAERPDAVLCIGQAGGRFDLTPERVAINLDDARIKDNEGNQPIDVTIFEDGAPAYFATLPIKAMAKEWGISVASRPSTPCMATRLPYNTPIDYDVMKQIEVGEGYLRELLGGNVRLRLHGNVVRIEADKTSFGKLLEHGDEIVKTLKDLGFVYITMDLEGFRSGSMDVGLDK